MELSNAVSSMYVDSKLFLHVHAVPLKEHNFVTFNGIADPLTDYLKHLKASSSRYLGAYYRLQKIQSDPVNKYLAHKLKNAF